ncbi:TrmH family RNA methyltransferase, partial [Roseiconus lacunae]|uniref:TrmH family RNA methyltransferase n=1 Tax=Roseiconus lacunae TaxID=2605694 RepID=UPI0028F458BC
GHPSPRNLPGLNWKTEILRRFQIKRHANYKPRGALAATLTDDSVSIDQYRTWYKHGDRPCVLVMGNEGNGLPLAVQRNCRHRIRIAMRPTIVGAPLLDSLNVSVAAAILMHDLTRTRSPTECDSPD